MQLKPSNILLIEDNPGDIELVRTGLEQIRLSDSLTVISDGQAALDRFDQDIPPPDLILLDINLPKVSGLEVLKRIRATPTTKAIPVVILTSSEAEEDIVRSYSEKANCCVSKPGDFDKFMEVMQTIEDFWLGVAKLPIRDC